MPVFNIAANTRQLPSGVEQYYKGKALRAQIEAQEIQNEQADEILADQQRRTEIDAENVDLRRQELNQRILEGITEQIEKGNERSVEATAGAAKAYLDQYNKTQDPVAAESAARAVYDKLFGKEGAYDAEMGGQQFTPEIAEAFVAAERSLSADTKTASQKVLDDLVDRGYIDENTRNRILKEQEEKAATVVGKTEFDSPLTDSQKGARHVAALDSYEESTNTQEIISDALPRVINTPGAVGIKGRAATIGAGLLSALNQEQLADEFTKMVAKASPEDISALQTQLQVIRGHVIELLTGEGSARISDQEREVANRTVGIIDQIQGPSDLARSYPQVIGSLRQLYVESWANKFRIASRDANISYPYNLDDLDDVTEMVEEFTTAGMDEQTIRQAFARLRSIQSGR